MGVNASKLHAGKLLAALFALSFGSGTMMATSLTVTSTVAVTCNTQTGPGAAGTIVVKPSGSLTGTNTIVVAFVAPSNGIVITPPASSTLTAANASAGLSFSVAVTAGCVGASTGSTTVQWTAASSNDVTSTVTDTVTHTASALVVTAPTITCGLANSVYTPGPAGTVSVTSAATGGTPFSVDTSSSGLTALPSWLVLSSTSGGLAGSTAVSFTVKSNSTCNALTTGTHTATFYLLNAPAPEVAVNVTVQVLAGSPLTANPTAPSLTYVKGSGSPGTSTVALSSSSPVFFAVYTQSLPIWLTVDTISGTTPKSIHFSSTSICDSLAPGTYTATVYINVSGYGALALPVTLDNTNKAPKLSVAEGTSRNYTWTQGTTIPTYYITAVSTDSPIPYTVTTGGTLAPVVSAAEQSGLAYSYGTEIPVTFNSLVFAAATPGSVLTGTVTLTWGSPASEIVVTFNITIQSPGATTSGISPGSIPTATAPATFNLILTGNGFVTGTDPTQHTKVGIVASNTIVADTNISYSVLNPSNISVTVTVPSVADANLPFATSGTGGTVVLGVCNPAGTTCSIPTGTVSFTIGGGPIIQAVVSGSAFVQAAPAVQSVAPYDMISLFGANFCASGGTGCTSTQVLYGQLSPTLTYLTSLSPDAAGPTARSVQVVFETSGGTVVGAAPLLFASNGQINAIVPSTVSTYIGQQLNIVVDFGYGTGATMKSSTPFPVNIVATDPGVFTVGADGQGSAAALATSTYALIGSANPAGMRATNGDSDVIQVYVTGLGIPGTGADNGSAGTVSGAVWSTDCISIASYLTSLNGSQTPNTSLTTVDGTILQSVLFNTDRLPPCIATTDNDLPTVTIGGISGTVLYAGWVADNVAGLYQVNVQLPQTTPGSNFITSTGASISSVTAPVQLPIVITSNSIASQAGVEVWVEPKLKVVAPLGSGLAGTVGQVWPPTVDVSDTPYVTATEGTSPYLFSLSTGSLPAGVTLNPNTGIISGTPAANAAGSYIVTVSVKDSAATPLTGSVTFTVTVAAGLVVSGTAPSAQTFGTANASLIHGIAAGGVAPYTYSLATPSPAPTGMTLNTSTGIMAITALTPAGTYPVDIHAVDSTSGTPLTGDLNFTLTIGLHVTDNGLTPGATGVASTITTVQAAGLSGTATYSLDAVSAALGWITIDSSTGVVAITTGAPGSTTQSVTVTATDSTTATGSSTAATGTITFSLHVN